MGRGKTGGYMRTAPIRVKKYKHAYLKGYRTGYMKRGTGVIR
jgi:hypothetical protein